MSSQVMATTATKDFTGRESVEEAQAIANGWAKEIARLHRENPSTLSAQDRLDIIELSNSFENAYDAQDLEGWLATWTDDAVLNSTSFGTAKGIEALRDFFVNSVKVMNGKRHVMSNHVIVGYGDTARMLSYLTVHERMTGTNIVGTAPFYDVLKKIDGTWRFARRDQVLDPGMYETDFGKELLSKFGAK